MRTMRAGRLARPVFGAVAVFLFLAAPAQARFLQADPLGYADDPDLYTYVQDDPVNHTDPTGRYSCGSSLKGGDCQTFMAAQKNAVATTKGALKSLAALRAHLLSGKLTAQDKAVQGLLQKFLGSGGVDAIDRLSNA
jgi:hypothetical protein